MKVNEIFLSIQGESTFAGLPTIFVRFTGCNLRCGYCDTVYAYEDGSEMTASEIFNKIEAYEYKRVCLTGGEPLLNGLDDLLELLNDYEVTIETNGSIAIPPLKNSGHNYIMDYKLPSSGCSENMLIANFEKLSDNDELKFVIADRNDYDCAKKVIEQYYKKGKLLFSTVFGTDNSKVVEWILEDKLDVRFQLQLHKYIWKPDARGV